MVMQLGTPARGTAILLVDLMIFTRRPIGTNEDLRYSDDRGENPLEL